MTSTDMVMTAYHDHRLVALSVVISILAAYAALALAERVGDARGRAWLAWLVGGATVDGIGTWSMHFTGELALRLPIPIQFDWPTVLLSLLVAIIGSALTLLVVGRSKIGWPRAIAASILLGGVGISCMHYTAMAAMRMPPIHYYSPSLVIVSVVLAIVVSLMALMLSFLLRDNVPGRALRYHGSAVLRGSANPIMHYTAMAAVTFAYSGKTPDLSHAVSISSLGILGISIVPVMVLVVALLTALVDRLQKQRTLLDELFERVPQAVALMSADNLVVRVNKEFTRVFGYSPQEIVDRSLSELIVPNELRDEEQKYAELIAHGQRVEAESVRQRKDGSRLYVSTIYMPVSLPGGQVAVYAIYRDVTERKRAEVKLKRSESQLAEALHIAKLGGWYWELRTGKFSWSDELYRLYGLQPQSVELTLETFLELVHPDGRETLRAALEKARRDQQPFTCYHRTILPDGRERIFYTRANVILGEDGAPIRVFGTSLDVTERKRAEEQLKSSHEKLRALSARLQSVREDESIRIAREIHDELGAALTSLRWDLESFDKIISESDERLQPQKLREKIEAMMELTDTIIGTVRRIASELRPSMLDDLGLAEAIEWQAQLFEARTGIICRCDCSLENLDLSREQSTAVFRIFQEALTNSLRHAQATSVDITMKAEAGEFVLAIIDNGRGITEDEKSGAQSLGLLGMQERAHLIGGKLNVTGVEGKGTVITVRVPISG